MYRILRTGFLQLWGLLCTSEFFCWPLGWRMRSQCTPQIASSFYITFHKSLLALLATLIVTGHRFSASAPPLLAAPRIVPTNFPQLPCAIPHGSWFIVIINNWEIGQKSNAVILNATYPNAHIIRPSSSEERRGGNWEMHEALGAWLVVAWFMRSRYNYHFMYTLKFN